MFETIVFPVDQSARSRAAAPHVEAFAQLFRSKVVVLHVIEYTAGQPGDLEFGGLGSAVQIEDRISQGRDLADSFLPGYTDVIRRVELGDPARTIIRVADDEDAGLIMMPTHGYGGFRRFILGSITAKVLHDAHCPVWTSAHVQDTETNGSTAVRHVLCAVDISSVSNPQIEGACLLAREFRANLTLAHVIPGPEVGPERYLDNEFRRDLMKEATTDLKEVAANCSVPAAVWVDAGDIAKRIASAAREHKADLVVTGRTQHSGLGRLRTHGYAIVRESPCAVLSF